GSAILFNVLLFALTVGTAAVGYWNREPAWINCGTVFFALLVIVRYFDWFWTLMPRSLFFIGGGLLLLLGGLALERTRRRLIDAALVPAAEPAGPRPAAPRRRVPARRGGRR